MYENHNSKKTFGDKISDDEFDFCNTETGQKFAIKWSPTEDIKLISKHRFSSTRPLSRSVPRRKRSLFQYRINRSLNFEIGTPMPETIFKSPSFDSDDGSICNEKYLTRSAKILRSLNINFSPSNKRTKKINKTLNFDSSPSPKRIYSSAESICNKESPKFDSSINREIKINKTLNFSSSSGGSNLSSYLGSSVNSIDENQNQTPSQRSRKVKKSLSYLTPSPELNSSNSGSTNGSPMSRETFITGLKRNASSVTKPKHSDGIGANAPRNLFRDSDSEDDKETRPCTPENFIQLVPESMSAIKKSHKKERQSNRSVKPYIRRLADTCDETPNSSEDPIVLSHSEERPATPITNTSYPSPNYSVGSIKQSHKKDKSKKKTVINYSDDEISDSGSIFDYTELGEETPAVANESPNNSANDSSPLNGAISDFQIVLPEENNDDESICVDNSIEELSDHGSIFDYSETFETKNNSNVNRSTCEMNDCQIVEKEPLKLSFDKLELISPGKCEEDAERCESVKTEEKKESRPITPENVINVLERVMTDSIKKSHKKIKDKNKKILFKPQGSMQKPQVESAPFFDEDRTEEIDLNANARSKRYIPENIARASTPENLNSSRLLLGQFSSVKKSHKKNKHKKIVTEFVKRQRYFNNNNNNNDRRLTPEDSSCVSGVETLSSPCSSSGSSASKRRKAISGVEVSTPADSSPGNGDRAANDCAMEMSARDESPLERSTPNKRKKSFSLNETGISTSSIDSSQIVDNSSMDYESAEEEFKIFTPIKKRRSLRAAKYREDVEDLKSTDTRSFDESDKYCQTEEESFKSFGNAAIATPPDTSRSREVTTLCKEDGAKSRPCEDESSNGRSTPQNQSTSIMVFDVNSIKKSHKKDKWNSRLRRHLNVDDDKSNFKPIRDEGSTGDRESSACRNTGSQNDSDIELKSPKPSTSRSEIPTDVETEKPPPKAEVTRTPPNCSKVMNYLKLLQADSIKRSHKKMREQKRHGGIVNDPELSDDGSIFDSSDKIGLNESNDSIGMIETVDGTTSGNETVRANGNIHSSARMRAQTPPNNSNSFMRIESIKKSHKKDREFKRIGTRDAEPYLSDDGSIFDVEEKLDESIDDLKQIEKARKSSRSD